MLETWMMWVVGTSMAVGALATAWFVTRLHLLTSGAWRRSDLGRHSMALGCVLLVLLVLANPALRALPWRWVPLLAGTAALAAVLVWRAILLERTQKSDRLSGQTTPDEADEMRTR